MEPLDVRARWFAGKDRPIRAVAPADRAGPLATVDVTYEDGGRERYLLVPDDPSVWARVVADPPPPLVLVPGPFPLPADPGRDAFVPSTDQTNTLAVVGGTLLVKAYRRLEPGPHPEVEVLRALAATCAPVPGFAGSLELGDTTVALLQEFVPGAEAGWEAPIEAAAAHLREAGDAAAPAAAALEPFAAAGRAAAELHAALAAVLPTAIATPGDLASWRAEAEAAVDSAVAGDEELANAAGAVRAELAALERVEPPPVQRIHGDLHYAQVLRAPGRLAIIDFEGDPTRPLAARRALDTPLRDLAALLRSIDHIGSAASRRAGWAPPGAWIDAARAAALGAYTAAARAAVDLRLLRALEAAKECAELVYARRVLPEWSYAPRLGLRRLLETETA